MQRANDKIVSIDFKDDLTDNEFKGNLKLRRKTMNDEMMIKSMKSILMNGQKFASESDELSVETIATIFVLFTDPSNGADNWFDRDKMTSYALINHLYTVHKDFEADFWRSDKRLEYQKFRRRLDPKIEGEDKESSTDKTSGVVGKDLPSDQGKYVQATVGRDS